MVTLVGLSLPEFVLGTLLIFVFAVQSRGRARALDRQPRRRPPHAPARHRAAGDDADGGDGRVRDPHAARQPDRRARLRVRPHGDAQGRPALARRAAPRAAERRRAGTERDGAEPHVSDRRGRGRRVGLLVPRSRQAARRLDLGARRSGGGGHRAARRGRLHPGEPARRRARDPCSTRASGRPDERGATSTSPSPSAARACAASCAASR